MSYYQEPDSHIKDKVKIVLDFSLLHLMCAIACAHTSTPATSLMHVKNSMHHFSL